MKINPVSSQNVVNSYKEKKTAQVQAADYGKVTDTVELSEGAKSFASVIRDVQKGLDVRTPAENQRYAEIARQIKEGTYQVSGQKVAEKMLGANFDQTV